MENREIAFRAWEDDRKKMVYGYQYYIGEAEYKNHPLMQYTGIKDVNNYNVFESDKVVYTLIDDSSQKEIEAVVEWHNYAWRLNRIWLLTEIKTIKVVGNIYENHII